MWQNATGTIDSHDLERVGCKINHVDVAHVKLNVARNHLHRGCVPGGRLNQHYNGAEPFRNVLFSELLYIGPNIVQDLDCIVWWSELRNVGGGRLLLRLLG